MSTIRAAHFSDLHYCEKHLDWVDRAMQAAVDDAISWKPDIALLTGDSFDAAIALHHPAVGRLIEKVRQLAFDMPVFILQGTHSHDRPGCLDVFKHLSAPFPVCVGDRNMRFGFDGKQWFDASDPRPAKFIVCAMPSVNRAEIRATEEDPDAANYVDRTLRAWAPANLEARAAGIPTILTTHGTVNGCVTESDQAMVSPDHEFSAASLFGCETSATMLGHIHAHQGWSIKDSIVQAGYCDGRARRIAFPGSITKLIYGHKGRVGYLKWTVGHDSADYTLFGTPSRELVDITFEGPPDMAELQRKLADLRGAFVRLRYSVDEEHRRSIDSEGIKMLLTAAGLAEFKIEPRINPVQRTRAAGISIEESVEKRLARWCELTGTDPEPLVSRLRILQNSAGAQS